MGIVSKKKKRESKSQSKFGEFRWSRRLGKHYCTVRWMTVEHKSLQEYYHQIRTDSCMSP